MTTRAFQRVPDKTAADGAPLWCMVGTDDLYTRRREGGKNVYKIISRNGAPIDPATKPPSKFTRVSETGLYQLRGTTHMYVRRPKGRRYVYESVESQSDSDSNDDDDGDDAAMSDLSDSGDDDVDANLPLPVTPTCAVCRTTFGGPNSHRVTAGCRHTFHLACYCAEIVGVGVRTGGGDGAYKACPTCGVPIVARFCTFGNAYHSEPVYPALMATRGIHVTPTAAGSVAGGVAAAPPRRNMKSYHEELRALGRYIGRLNCPIEDAHNAIRRLYAIVAESGMTMSEAAAIAQVFPGIADIPTADKAIAMLSKMPARPHRIAALVAGQEKLAGGVF